MLRKLGIPPGLGLALLVVSPFFLIAGVFAIGFFGPLILVPLVPMSLVGAGVYQATQRRWYVAAICFAALAGVYWAAASGWLDRVCPLGLGPPPPRRPGITHNVGQ